MYVYMTPQMCFEWFTKGQHDLESDVQQQLFKEKILKLEPYEITMNGEVHPVVTPLGCVIPQQQYKFSVHCISAFPHCVRQKTRRQT